MVNADITECRQVLIFDLDDTLYPEATFVESGFRAVANHLQRGCGVSADSTFEYMSLEIQRSGRGRIFNSLSAEFQISGVSIAEMIAVYRSHAPKIRLYDGAESVLCGLKKNGFPLYLITDGNPRVQRSKIKALELRKFFKKTYCTRDFGILAEKPSLRVFELVARQENVGLSQITYIGDDPAKDFHGLVSAGGKAIRVRTGRYRQEPLPEKLELWADIKDLKELPSALLSRGLKVAECHTET